MKSEESLSKSRGRADQEKQSGVLPLILMPGLIVLMVASAGLLGENEIIFPEIAALATGYILAPKRTWNVSGTRMLIMIGGGAVLGLIMSIYLPGPQYARLLIAFFVGQLILALSGTGLAPVISACVLPVMLYTNSIIYPVSAFVLTLLIVLSRRMLEHMDIRPREPYVPDRLPVRSNVYGIAVRTGVYALMLLFLVPNGLVLASAPPLLVAFTECCNPDGRPRRKPWLTVLLLFLASLNGAGMRLLFCTYLHLPLTLSAAAASVVLILILKWSGFLFPPVGAITILAMLIQESALPAYPLEVLGGSTVFMLAASVFFRSVRKQNSGPLYPSRGGRKIIHYDDKS